MVRTHQGSPLIQRLRLSGLSLLSFSERQSDVERSAARARGPMSLNSCCCFGVSNTQDWGAVGRPCNFAYRHGFTRSDGAADFSRLALVQSDQPAALAVDVIPEPSHHRKRPKFDFVASYVNFYVCNAAVIAPQFGDATTDRIAQLALQRHYPNREIVTLNTDPLGEIGGGIHCATQQIPS